MQKWNVARVWGSLGKGKDLRLTIPKKIGDELYLQNRFVLVEYTNNSNVLEDVMPIYKMTRSYSLSVPKNIALQLNVKPGDEINYRFLEIKNIPHRGKNRIKIINGKKYFNLLTIAPENVTTITSTRKYDVNLLCFKRSNNSIIFWYKPKRGRTPEPLTTSALIPFTQRTAGVFGLFQGELAKTRKATGISFANSIPKIINETLRFFRVNFGISEKTWTGKVEYTGRKFSNVEEKIRTFWRSMLKIKVGNVIVKNSRCQEKTSSVGVLELWKGGVILKEIIIKMLYLVRNEILEDKRLCKSFIQGLMAADGWPQIINKHLTYMSIGLSEKKLNEEGIFYHKLLKSVGINSTVSKNKDIKICGWDDFYKLAKVDIFKLQSERQILFLEGLKNHSCTKILRSIPQNKEIIIFPETFEKEVKLKKEAIGRAVRDLARWKFLDIKYTRNPTRYRVRLTKRGRRAYSLFLNLEGELRSAYLYLDNLNKKLGKLNLGQIQVNLNNSGKIRTVW